MEIYKYKDYNDYKSHQVIANKSKLNNCWVQKETIEKIKSFCKDQQVKNILCHGTRNGTEQKIFLKCFPNATVLGTEISDTAKKFEMTIEWDFQNQKEDWIRKWDIVYSNSFDHTIKPRETMIVWGNQLSGNGTLFLEMTLPRGPLPADPLGITEEELLVLSKECGLDFKSKFATFGKNKLPSTVYIFERKS